MAKLYFYYAAMDAGKSTMLLQSNYNYRERGMQTLLLMPEGSSREGKREITSRIGLAHEAHTFGKQEDLLARVRSYLEAHEWGLHCILIDEAQFLTKAQVEAFTAIVDCYNIPVLAYGLRTDFRGELFEGSRYLLAWADELTEIKTMCHCGKKATMNVRMDAEGKQVTQGDQVAIGGNEMYMATCRKHHKGYRGCCGGGCKG